MGHKVNPIIFRIGFIKTWSSRWFAKRKDYGQFVSEDYNVRKYIKKKFKQAAISKITIDRTSDRVRVRIFSARPGIIIGRHGADIEKLRADLNGMFKREVIIDIEEIKDPGLDAQLVSENVAYQLEKRIAYRRAIKRSIEQTMQMGAKGVKVKCSGRLGGAEMSRTETFRQGKIPLQTLRADIDYGFAESLTTYGLIGIKCWIYKGDVLGRAPAGKNAEAQQPEAKDAAPSQEQGSAAPKR
jgi:small subunit ribosomal protein S3